MFTTKSTRTQLSSPLRHPPKFPYPPLLPDAPRYHGAVRKALVSYVRQHHLLRAGERVGVAVSGGADSVALLRALVELAPTLGIVPFVLHLNHRLRGAESDADEQFVRQLADELKLEAVIEGEDVSSLAALLHLSLEAAGRRARYAFFQRAACSLRLNAVATAHTRDDQAETVLLRLLRGAGTSGLAGVHTSFDLYHMVGDLPGEVTSNRPRIIRPMLGISRQQVEEYLGTLDQPFQQDTSNQSQQFLRNRVRANLLPQLEEDYNPQLRHALCETAEIAAAENDYFERLTLALFGQNTDPEQGVDLEVIQCQPLAMQRRLLRHLCQLTGLALDFAHLEQLREFSQEGQSERLLLPRGFCAEITRSPGVTRLRLLPSSAENQHSSYDLELTVPGMAKVGPYFGEEGTHIRATLLGEDQAKLAHLRADLLRADQVQGELTVRSLHAGDRYHPLFARDEAKIGRLLQRLSVPGVARKSWPVVTLGERIVWAPGLPVAAEFAWTPGDGQAVSLDLCNSSGAPCNTLSSGRTTVTQLSLSQVARKDFEIVISEAQLQSRIAALGRRISRDYAGRSIFCIGVLENGFIFVADLLRSIQGEVRCQFVRTNVREILDNNIHTTEIFYTPEVDVEGQHVLLCEGIVSSGQTTDFLIRNLKARGAASIKVCTLLDRQSSRRVEIEVDYFGFQVGPQWLAGFGLGSPTRQRNLPFIFAAPELEAAPELQTVWPPRP